jgi:hypothetical protein
MSDLGAALLELKSVREAILARRGGVAFTVEEVAELVHSLAHCYCYSNPCFMPDKCGAHIAERIGLPKPPCECDPVGAA